MSIFQRLDRRRWRQLLLAVLLSLGALYLVVQALADDPEIALMMGEPWEDMRERSSAGIYPAPPGVTWFGIPKSDARLRFIDPQYGFVTPLARFFTIGFVDERVRGVRMSPQVEPLLLDDALKVVLDLQDQWRRSGWVAFDIKRNPPISDSPEYRERLRDVNKGGSTYWQAGEQYQIVLYMNRFKYSKRPDEERFLITLSIGTPWVPNRGD